ncbi:hypothetical protein [Desulfosporosinus sp. FKA]|nr:hypothetical protein [Desulfosporosinus sp. FKA]
MTDYQITCYVGKILTTVAAPFPLSNYVVVVCGKWLRNVMKIG